MSKLTLSPGSLVWWTSLGNSEPVNSSCLPHRRVHLKVIECSQVDDESFGAFLTLTGRLYETAVP